MRKILIPLTAAVATLGLAVPAAVADRSFEGSCADIVGGGGDYQRLVLALRQEQVAPGVYSQAHNELLPRGVMTADLTLPQASCTDTTYTLLVYSDQVDASGQRPLLVSTSRRGDGTSTTVVLEAVVNGHSSSTVYVQVHTSDRRGNVIDLGSDSGPIQATARADGGPGGGGNIGWG